MRDERAAEDALGGSGALWAGVELDPAALAIVVDSERDASPFFLEDSFRVLPNLLICPGKYLAELLLRLTATTTATQCIRRFLDLRTSSLYCPNRCVREALSDRH
jgi:hypothetical protein